MSENLTTNVELDSTANGTVSFATDVVATIAGLDVYKRQVFDRERDIAWNGWTWSPTRCPRR